MYNYKSIQMPLLNVDGFNDFIYKEYKPSEELKPYICCYWYLKTNKDIDGDYYIRVLPDGCINLVFSDYNKPFDDNSLLIGLNKKPSCFVIKNHRELFGIRLYPGTSGLIFNCPASEFLDKTIPLKYFWGDILLKINNELSKKIFIYDKIELIEAYIKSLLINKMDLKLDPIVQNSLNYIYDAKGQVSVNEIANNLNISSKSLFRKYNNWIGISPKLFCRIVRFQNTLKDITSLKEMPLCELALENGYYDQPHFIKEFKEFYGNCPSELFNKYN
ncbi:MAG TPA: hypothetical protein DIU45_09525 [Clostridium sp.]|nr:hypothetical protein [Clostridium sp.]